MKYYGVRIGRNIGVYKTWVECKKEIDGYSNARFKSFTTRKEAEEYVYGDSSKLKTIKLDNDSNSKLLTAYVDGSFSDKIKAFSFGCVLLEDGEVLQELYGKCDHKDYVSMRNVAGEILGAKTAVKFAIKNGYEAINIHYDYEGIEKWATKRWKANKMGTAQYQAYMQEAAEKININFFKVKAHTGDTYNEMADKLAKKAVNIR